MDIIAFISSNYIAIIAVFVVFGALIFFHELGHFLAAKAMGIGIVTFSLGFGPKIFSFKKGKTTYCLSLLPLGGYLATVGEYDDRVEELGFTEEEAITKRPPWQRIVLAICGPLANFIMAFFIYWAIAWSYGDAYLLPEIEQVVENSPAAKAGIQAKDTILAINGFEIQSWEDAVEKINTSKGQNLDFLIQRGNEELNIAFQAEQSTKKNVFGEDEEAWIVGIVSGSKVQKIPVGPIKAVQMAGQTTWEMLSLTVQSFAKLFSGSVSSDNVGGPILIVQMIGEQAQVGLLPLLLLTALISVNLGLLNLFPLPVLDGGIIVFSLYEIIAGKSVSEWVQEKAMLIGVMLLVSLMIFATYNDIVRLITG